MISVVRHHRIPTIGTIPFLAAEIMRRNAARDRKRLRRKVHTAKLGPNETVESNLPLK